MQLFRVLSAVCFAAALAAAQVQGVPNFHKVNDGIYRGGQPSPDGFRSLASLGVRTVIDLRETGEHSQSQEATWVKADGMRYVSIPMGKLSAPHDADVARTLSILADRSAEPVFLHCRRGSDRTGTVVACYRILHDHWRNRQALDEARQYGMSRFELAMQHYILRFTPEIQSAEQ